MTNQATLVAGDPRDPAEADAIAALATSDWPAAAAHLLADLGFSLINSDRPSAAGGSHLLVALRPEPTLHHFDPEAFSYWAPLEPHARQVVVDRATIERARALDARVGGRVLWGHLHVADRLAVENRFLTFGGELRTARIDTDLTVLDLVSPAPLVRWGGHSQATDPLATEVGAFFGRLIVPVDFIPGAERRLAEEQPEAIYAACLAWADARLDRIAAATGTRNELESWIDQEEARLRGSRPDQLARGREILAELSLG
jgi:hypothetical protein